MPSQRNTAMDLVRGTCIFLVFLFHAMPAVETFAALDRRTPVTEFNAFFQPYRMTLLMFLSGLLLHRSLKKPFGVFFEGKLASIYLPFLLWSVLVLIAEGRVDLETLLKMPISAPTVLWYLWFLFAYYLLAFVVERFKINLLLVIAATFLASLVLPDFLRMSRFAYLFGFFMMGHFFASRMDLIPRSGLFAAAMLVVVVIGGIVSASGYKINYDSRFVLFPIALVLLISWVMPYYSGGRGVLFLLTRVTEWVGRNSIVFYVIHFPVQVVFVRTMTAWTSPVDASDYIWLYLGAAVLPLLIGGVATWAREKSLYVAALFDFRHWKTVFGWSATTGSVKK